MQERNDEQWLLESQRLERVLEEATRQLEENRSHKERFTKDYIATQKEMWEDVGSLSISNGLDQIVDFMQFMDTMKHQKRSHELTQKLEEKFERMLLSPYFGRMDFTESGDAYPEACYIGISNLVSEDYDFLIYDWRAPISSMYYEYEVGKASYECPEGQISGDLSLKRQYKIVNGEMEFMFDSSLKIDDEMLQDLLSKSTDNRMKSIVNSIQREQNQVIRNETFRCLVVQGPAGSGKTSVALHRIAYLLYKHRERIKPENIIIFSPNDIFNDYISNVLPQLGEDNMFQTTFKEYMQNAIGGGFTKEDYGQMMEYILEGVNEPHYQKRMKSIAFKSSLAFVSVLKAFVQYMENEKRPFVDLIFNGKLIISQSEINDLYFKDYASMNLKRRLLKLKNRLLFLVEPIEKQRLEVVREELESRNTYMEKHEIKNMSYSIVKNEFRDIYSHIDRMTAFDLSAIHFKFYKKLEQFAHLTKPEFSKQDLELIKSYSLKTLGSRVLNYEEQPVLLYLKSALGDQVEASGIKYVIIDEAQDYSPLQYEIFRQLFKSASLTMLGDLNQSINPHMNVGGYENLAHIFPREEMCLIELTKSYRSTVEITDFARRLLPSHLSAGCVGRHGEIPKLIQLSDEAQIRKNIVADIKHYKEKGNKSIGIITRTVREAERVFELLKKEVDLRAILKDDDAYVCDTLVIPAYLAKGLEFDVVLLYNVGGEHYVSEGERLLLYTAMTRALHTLHLYYCGPLSPLLEPHSSEMTS